MKKLDTQNKNKAELEVMLKDLNEKLVQMRFDLAGKKLKDFSQLGKAKRDIARILTVLNNI